MQKEFANFNDMALVCIPVEILLTAKIPAHNVVTFSAKQGVIKEPEKPAPNKKSDKKDDSKSGSGNKRVIEQQKTQKPHTRPMQPRIHRNGGEQK